jgi:type IV secretory pathway VirJ component
MLHLDIRDEQFDVLQEVKKSALKPLCLFGEKEEPTRTEHFKAAGAKIIILPGNHHFDDNFDLIVERILKGE